MQAKVFSSRLKTPSQSCVNKKDDISPRSICHPTKVNIKQDNKASSSRRITANNIFHIKLRTKVSKISPFLPYIRQRTLLNSNARQMQLIRQLKFQWHLCYTKNPPNHPREVVKGTNWAWSCHKKLNRIFFSWAAELSNCSKRQEAKVI